jgi:hypothetical protein
MFASLPKVHCDLRELVQRRLQIFRDLGGDHVGIGEIGRILQTFIFQPEDVQAHLVALQQILVREGLEALGLFALV